MEPIRFFVLWKKGQHIFKQGNTPIPSRCKNLFQWHTVGELFANHVK